jgi:hypothetical protein
MTDKTILKEISAIVANTVVETFNGMFGQSVVTATVNELAPAGEGKTSVCLILKNEKGLPAKFYFSFDDNMLKLTALNFFAAELSSDPRIRNDIACAVANIVGTKVKNCLNEHGHKFEMTFPYAVKEGEVENARDALYLHFAYNDAQGNMNDTGLVVNFMMKEQRAAGGEYLN